MKLEFKEVQRFKQWWLWLIVMAGGIMPVIGIYKQIYKGVPWGDKPMSNTGLIIFACFTFALIGLFLMMKLKTEIDENGIRIRFVPFTSKQVRWSDIKSIEVVEYGFVGGWGIRLGTKYGTVYNIKGKNGLAIELKNGKKFLVGTQRQAELEQVVRRARTGIK